MAEQESWYHRYPDYRVDLVPSKERMQAQFGATVIATSDAALIVEETDHTAVVYFPLDDINLEWFTVTDHHTFCPFKGEASYWTLTVNDDVAENVMWAYPDPFPQVAGLQRHAAFYGDRVAISAAGTQVT